MKKTIFSLTTAALCAIACTMTMMTAQAKSSMNEMNMMPMPCMFNHLNVVEFPLQAEQWVNTNVALVTISADATLDKNSGLTQTRAQLLKKFAELADNANWNITVFNTSQSESGLEQMHVEAQARLAEDKLSNLRTKAKDLSKPGLALRLVSVDFTPSVTDMEAAKAALRTVIYNAANAEIARINKAYPEQKYVLRSITFQQVNSSPAPMALAGGSMMAAAAPRGKQKAADSSEDAAALLAVSTKIQMEATVELAPAPITTITSTSSIPMVMPGAK